MEFVASGVILVTVIAALNIALTWAVSRRWRQRIRAFSVSQHHGAPFEADLGIAVGDRMPVFTGTTATGETVTNQDLAGQEALIAFLSLDCPSCDASVPAFTEVAEAVRTRGGRIMATVVGIDAVNSELLSHVSASADFVIPEFLDAPFGNLFDARVYPCFVHYGHDGVVTASGYGLEGLGEIAQPATL
ncbi:peroxiredoxin family protein [Streptomyces sp. NPDC048248]|uniref:peroxiredoxin family protein n=1 Tax=Streptomyces sp. NPDC048248 TaxID=3365523 RepID=UPI0037139E5E